MASYRAMHVGNEYNHMCIKTWWQALTVFILPFILNLGWLNISCLQISLSLPLLGWPNRLKWQQDFLLLMETRWLLAAWSKLVTGDFHQLCVLLLKICNNIAVNSPSFFLMNVRRPCMDWWGGFWEERWAFLLISNWGILKKLNTWVFHSWKCTKLKYNRAFFCWVSHCLPLNLGLAPCQQDPFHPAAHHSLFHQIILPPRLPTAAAPVSSHSQGCSKSAPPLLSSLSCTHGREDTAEGEISSPKADTLISPVARNSEQQTKHTRCWQNTLHRILD